MKTFILFYGIAAIAAILANLFTSFYKRNRKDKARLLLIMLFFLTLAGSSILAVFSMNNDIVFGAIGTALFVASFCVSLLFFKRDSQKKEPAK